MQKALNRPIISFTADRGALAIPTDQNICSLEQVADLTNNVIIIRQIINHV
jgi:hypothetical protein